MMLMMMMTGFDTFEEYVASGSKSSKDFYQGEGVVRDSNLGHQLLLPPANWCPIFASRTT